MLARDKHSSLFSHFISYEEKKFFEKAQAEANVIKKFTAVSYEFSKKARAFVPGSLSSLV
jgi:hypothetical protein